MTVEEKAKELVDKFLQLIDHQNAYWDIDENAKVCAKLHVEEMISVLEPIEESETTYGQLDFYREVKTEIEKL